MKNEVLHEIGFLQGDYQMSTQVNGKPSWTKSTHAIYYMLSGHWVFGPLESIGGDFAWIHARNDFSGLTDSYNAWTFYNGNSFTPPSDPKDIQVTYIHEW